MISEKSNNILTLVLKNGETTSLSFPSGKDIESALELALKFEGIKKEHVKKYFFSIDSEKNLEDFNYFNGEKEEIDEIQQSIDFKVDEVRRQRDVLFKKLGMQNICFYVFPGLVGLNSTYPGDSPIPWCRVMT